MPLIWKWMGLFLRKHHLVRCWGWLSRLNWIGALTLSLLLKLPPRKLERCLALWSFFLQRLLCISTNLPFSQAWDTLVMSGLVLLVATWNWWISYKNGYAGLLFFTCCLSWTLGSSSKLSPFYRYYFDRCLSELAELVPIHVLEGVPLVILIDCMNFFLSIPRCYKDAYVNKFFPGRARLWNSLPIQCFPLTFYLNASKSRINWHLLNVSLF